MTDKEKTGSGSYYSTLTSIPLWAKHGQIASVRQATFERLLIRLKDPTDQAATEAFLRDLRQSLDP